MLSKEEIEEADKIFKMFNTKISDCNKCPYLNMTEEKQNEVYRKTGMKLSHMCKKYNVKVIHMCSLNNKPEHHKLFPLNICDTKEIEIFFSKGGQ